MQEHECRFARHRQRMLEKMTLKISNSPCRALTNKGKPCRAAATGGGLCFFHANPNKAVELRPDWREEEWPYSGRLGSAAQPGQRNGYPRLRRPTDLRVYAGRLHPRITAGLAPLMRLQLRVHEKTELEKRLARVEGLPARLTGRGLKGLWSQIGREQRAGRQAIKGMRQNRWLYPARIMA